MGLFNKVLIANRGEIARRIIRTCKGLGIQTVAVYSDADKNSIYVKEAAEAVHIGENQAKKSYLNIEKIMAAAKVTNADAIHPGYGFLSENPELVKRCEAEGITFIGPKAEVMELMSSKLESRMQMYQAGIPVVPGSEKRPETVEQAIAVAEDLGYPLMLKASAGGGGIGMKLIKSAEELTKNFSSVKQQAQQFFSDDTVFLEKWISNPRHIEVQVAGDTHGNMVHLFERECSVQRRHQKVIEETPSPFLNETQRKELVKAALIGAKHLGYTNVGTMEFIFDGEANFYFLEMNTRLQVEHAVTEEVTGIDLVEWQLRIAANEYLPRKQHEVTKQGHAIECRIYAEDPVTHFPSPGTISKLNLTEDEARYEFGVIEKTVVSPFYDPMIGKVIVHAKNREAALQQMKGALEKTKIEGIKTNIPLLEKIMNERQFELGDYTTNYLQELGNIIQTK